MRNFVPKEKRQTLSKKSIVFVLGQKGKDPDSAHQLATQSSSNKTKENIQKQVHENYQTLNTNIFLHLK